MARHTGKEHHLLRLREQTYHKARQRHPERWSREIRNCDPVPAVTLNPARKKNEVPAAA
jgi:putative transposase